MRSGTRPFSFTKRGSASMTFSGESIGVASGLPNGFGDIESMGLSDFPIEAGPHNISPIGRRIRSSARSWPSAMNLRPTRAAGPPYPPIRARRMGDLQQTDLVGPRYLRGSRGITRFSSFHTIDAVGQTASASQFSDKQTLSLCRHLVDSWRVMGRPRVSQMDNEMSASGGGRYRYNLSQTIRLHLLLGIHLLFIPQGEPGRNAAVESFNGLWQKRVLFHRCPDLRALRRTSARFIRYYHFQKPSRRSTVTARSSSTAPNISFTTSWNANMSWLRSRRITGGSSSSLRERLSRRFHFRSSERPLIPSLDPSSVHDVLTVTSYQLRI